MAWSLSSHRGRKKMWQKRIKCVITNRRHSELLFSFWPICFFTSFSLCVGVEVFSRHFMWTCYLFSKSLIFIESAADFLVLFRSFSLLILQQQYYRHHLASFMLSFLPSPSQNVSTRWKTSERTWIRDVIEFYSDVKHLFMPSVWLSLLWNNNNNNSNASACLWHCRWLSNQINFNR